jgi:hypothetical protein
MANSFGIDILTQAQDPMEAASFYVTHLGFEIIDSNPKMIGLHGDNINLFIEPGPNLGPVLEVTVENGCFDPRIEEVLRPMLRVHRLGLQEGCSDWELARSLDELKALGRQPEEATEKVANLAGRDSVYSKT